ncbi:hypothetical protein HYPSUDRAFT_108156, partial [Hypholoma sublateritium FD-334 SS-4]
MTRWISYLQLFDFEMQHISADHHKAPDGLSRRRPTDADSDNESDDQEQDRFIGAVERSDCAEILGADEVRHILSVLRLRGLSQRQMESAPYISHAPIEQRLSPKEPAQRAFITTLDEAEPHLNTKERRRFEKKCSRYFIHDDRLWTRPTKNQQPRLVIIDLEKRRSLMVKAHDECGHRGRDPTYDHLRERYFWPNMYDQIAYFYARVPTVLRHFGMDTVHMSAGYGGKNYIVQAHDSLSQWPEAEDIAKANHQTIARFVYRNIICRFG